MNGIARWDGSGWSDLSGGVADVDGRPIPLALASIGTDLYVGGKFSSAGGVPVQRFARWDGSSWAPATSFRGVMEAMDAVGNRIYVGGLFNFFAGSVLPNNMAFWNGNR